MTTTITSNGSKWYGEAPDSIDKLLDAAKAVLQIWDDLYSNQSDPEEREAWNTLRAAIAKAEGGTK